MTTIEPLSLATRQGCTLLTDATDRSTDRRVTAGNGMSTRRRAVGGLPLPTIQQRTHSASNTYYVVSSIDARGRFADRSAQRRLRWPPGTKITIRPTGTRVIITRDPDGVDAVTVQGHLRLPARIRHVMRLSTGDRLLMAADLHAERLVAYPMSAVDAIFAGAARSDGELP